MSEIELKFQIPAPALPAVRRALATASATSQTLRARYFDTPDQALARAGIALRQRLEGDVWVQTVKAPHSALERLEHEVRLPTKAGADLALAPALRLERHHGHPVHAKLMDALGEQGAATLALVFETDIVRTSRISRRAGAQVEMALDLGHLRAGPAELVVREIEFELKSGSIDGLLSTVRQWLDRHPLWLDLRSKAERGQNLAQGRAASPARGASQPVLAEDLNPDQALRRIVSACLDQILPNVSTLAAGLGEADHVHQARVGLRRLRTALKVLGAWSPGLPEAWAEVAGRLFADLGRQRDADVLLETLQPVLSGAGVPAELGPALAGALQADPTMTTLDLPTRLQAPDAQQLWLDLLAYAHGQAMSWPESAQAQGADRTESGPRLHQASAALLPVLERKLVKLARRFDSLDDEERHTTRKRLKRLRYTVEFLQPLLRRKATERYLQALKPAQDALGLYNDLVVAEQRLAHLPPGLPGLWFVQGWLAVRRPAALTAAAVALRHLPTVTELIEPA